MAEMDEKLKSELSVIHHQHNEMKVQYLPRGYSGFQVTGMIEGFFGFEIFDSRIFFSRKIWQVFFFGWLDLSGDFFGYSKQSEDLWWCKHKHSNSISNVFIFRVTSFNAFWKFLRLTNSAWDFLGVNFCSRDFFGF